MRRKLLAITAFAVGIFIFLYSSFSCFKSQAGSGLLFGNLITVTNTNSSVILGVGQVSLPLGRFIITNSGLTNFQSSSATNNFFVFVQESLDQTNWINVATYTPLTTNSIADTFVPQATPNVYMRAQIFVPTNIVNCAITFQQ